MASSKGPEAVKNQHVEVPKDPEVQRIEKPEVEAHKNVGDDDYVEFRVSTPPPPPPENVEVPESSQPKNTVLPGMFEGFSNVRGELKDDFVLEESEYSKKEKAKAEADRDELKRQLEELKKVNEEIKSVMIKQAKKLKKIEGDVDDNAKLFELLSTEIIELHVKNVKLNDINKTLNQLKSDIHEASANGFKAMKLEMEAMKAEERRIERERRLAEEATQRKKDVIIETQEAGGSSSQADIEMVNAELDPKGFEKEVERTRMLLLRWKEEEKVEEEEEKINDHLFEYIDNYPEGNEDDDDQGSSGLLIVNPLVQQRIEDFMNDEINEQEEDHQQESSSSGKQHADQVFLTQPTVIYLHARVEREIEVPRSRADMLEELGLEDGMFKFDIEDEIPSSPEKGYEFKYAQEADKYNDVLVEDGSDSSDDETVFHYAGVDNTFPSLAEMFKEQNEDEVRRKIVEKITTEGVPRTIPRENLVEERKKWFKVMPKERKFIRPLQYITHDADISWGDILSWGYLEDLQVYAIRWEQGHDQHLWDYIKQQAKVRFPDWKPQFPKQIVTILESGEEDITLDIKPPRCLKIMPLCAMEQDFHEEFQGWLYNQSTAEAVIRAGSTILVA
ncbi:hypothetical protein Hanom_Chr01g00042841 [Helianthus anomalus]